MLDTPDCVTEIAWAHPAVTSGYSRNVIPTPAAKLKRPVTFWYLATPYSRYPYGIEAAYSEACIQTALLIRAGIPVFSPIAHTHGVAVHGNIDPLDHTVWIPSDQPMMDAASGLIMLQMQGWQESFGMALEYEAFRDAGKDIVFMTPGHVPSFLRRTVH